MTKEKKIMLLDSNREVIDNIDDAIALAKCEGYTDVIFTISTNESKGCVGITFERLKKKSYLIERRSRKNE